MKIMEGLLVLCFLLFCFASTTVLAAEEKNGDYTTEDLNETEMIHESVEELRVESEEVVDEEPTEEDVVTIQSYTAEITGLTWVMRDTYIDVGAAYTTNDLNVQFRWLEYNLDTEQWRTIAGWNSGNWASWKSNVGDYWLHCEMRTSDGQVVTKTMSFHYTAGNLKITGTYAGFTEAYDTTVLLGMTGSLTSGVKYSFKIYNVDTGVWTSISDKKVNNWVTWGAKTGTYWTHFELYTDDGRLADTKTYAFGSTEPVRRALIMGETSTNQVPIGDVDNMNLLNINSTYYGKPFYSSVKFANKTKAQIISKIQTTFADTVDSDVSYLYFTCHGGDGGKLYLEPNQLTFTPLELRNIIDTYIKGKVVIVIDSCHSGGSINKDSTDDLEEFASSFIQVFEDESKSGELQSDRFAVLCSSRNDEPSYGGSTVSVATKYWLEGAGWSVTSGSICSLFADSNGDNKVSLDELYQYSYDKVVKYMDNQQHTVCSPEGSEIVLFGRY